MKVWLERSKFIIKYSNRLLLVKNEAGIGFRRRRYTEEEQKVQIPKNTRETERIDY
jgi:hypothetical protein